MDLDAFHAAVTDRTRAIFLANPGMPTGFVLNEQEWEAVAGVCRDREVRLIYVAWMEAVLFDGRPLVHPGSLEGMRERVITVGSVSLEQRMIGWRIGWLVAAEDIARDLQLVHIYNGLTAGGVAQAGAAAALRAGEDDMAAAVTEWGRRRDAMFEELSDWPVVRPGGAWSMLVDVEAAGYQAPDVSRRLLEHKVAATPMTAWGETVAPRHVRFVYSNEPVERIRLLGDRVRAALRG
jgi:aspartate/methionine/tyrosine aminotransferase